MMQQMVSWRFWLRIGLPAIFALAFPVYGQDQAPSGAPPTGSDAKSYVQDGVSHGAQGDLDGAIDDFNKAIGIDPKFAPAYFYRARAYSLQHKTDAAISDYNEAILLEPDYKEAYFQRGGLWGEKGDFDKALSDFTQLIKLDPKDSRAHYNRGHVLYFMGDLNGAFDELNQAITLEPNYPLSYFIRGLVRHAQGAQEAKTDFEKSSSFGFPYASFWAWITQTEDGQHGVARKELEDALLKPDLFKSDDWPTQIGNYMLERITQTQLMDRAKTDNDSETSARLCEAWFYCGIKSRLAGNTKEASDCFTQAIATGSKGSEEYVEANRELAKLQQSQ